MRASGAVLLDKGSTSSVDIASLVDRSPHGNDGTFTDITISRLASGLQVHGYNGTSSKIAVGDTDQLIKSFSCWINPDDVTTRSIVDFDGGTHSIEIDGSGDITATGWTSPIIYVNGAVAAAVALNAWSQVVVTSTTAFEASNLTIGQEASFYSGKAVLYEMLTRVLSAGQALQAYNATKGWFE